jgi:hypothetical protein
METQVCDCRHPITPKRTSADMAAPRAVPANARAKAAPTLLPVPEYC